MEKALIFNHNLPYDVNVHIVAEDTITLVPRFESKQVKDLYIDFHLQGYTDSKLGLAKWKTDLENMPARSLIYKNAKEITFTIDIVNYNEDVLNRNFAVTKTESGNYKFWWIKKITRIGQLKSTLYNVYLTLDYWWTYGIDTLFDNDKQVLIKRAHVKNYELIEFNNHSYYRMLKDVWSNPFINAGEEFQPKEANYIFNEFEHLHFPYITYTDTTTHITTPVQPQEFINRCNIWISNMCRFSLDKYPHAVENGLLNVGADIFYYWKNDCFTDQTKDCLDLKDEAANKDTNFPNGILIAAPYVYMPSKNYIHISKWSYHPWGDPDIKTPFILYQPDTDRPGFDIRTAPIIKPFQLISDSQRIPLSSSRIPFNYVWYVITNGDILNIFSSGEGGWTWDSWMQQQFQREIYPYTNEPFASVTFISSFTKTTFSNPAIDVLYATAPIQGDVTEHNLPYSLYNNNYLWFDKFLKPFYLDNTITADQFHINALRTLQEVKIYIDPYTKYRLINPSKNQMDIMSQYVNNKYALVFNHIITFNPGENTEVLVPMQFSNDTDYLYGKDNNYCLNLTDNTNFGWPEETNAYNEYMLRNKSFLHQNQVDKYVHGGFKTVEDTASTIGSFLHLNFGAGAKGVLQVGEDAYSLAQVALDYNAKMTDLKRTPGKWESKNNSLLTINAFKLDAPMMFKLELYEPLLTNVKNLFIAHGYSIGGYHKIYQFINGVHQRYFFNYLQAVNCLNIISKELSLQIKMGIQAALKAGIQIRHIRKEMLNSNGSWKYKNKFNDYSVNNVEYHLAIIPNESN